MAAHVEPFTAEAARPQPEEWRVMLVGERLAGDARLRRRLGTDYSVAVHDRSREALAAVRDDGTDVAIVEQVLRDGRGVDFLRELRISHPDIIRVLLLDNADPQVVQHAISDAAVYQVVITPWQPEPMHLLVTRALESRELSRIHRHLARELKFTGIPAPAAPPMRCPSTDLHSFDRLVFVSRAMTEVCQLARKAAHTDLPVLIEGETGTGKELMARAVHRFSGRNQQAFMAENCGVLSAELLQSELFGHKRGAFTGATTDRLGLFLAADGGTVLLDEISEISPGMQVALLRFLQEGEVRPLGADHTRKVNVRIIAASNRPLRTLVAEGRFRQDLYYRLRGFELRLPPLRERPEDIPVLVTHLLQQHAATLSRRVAGVTRAAMSRLAAHPFPGNVRELENEVRRMFALAEDGELITPAHLSAEIAQATPRGCQPIPDPPGRSLKEKVEALEARLVCDTLDRCHWNCSKAARELGLSRVGLANKIRRYHIRRAGEE